MKRVVPIALAAALLTNLVCAPLPVGAVAQTVTLERSGGALSVEGVGSFGNLVTSAIEEEADRRQEEAGYGVFSIEVDGSRATVSFETQEDCSLVVAVYDGTGERMVSSSTVEVSKGDTEATVDVSDLPQYFYVRGFLVDSKTLRPLCTSYENPNYTREMQEFLSKTTDDFDEDRVLNLDGDKTNNFAVYRDDVVVVPQDGGHNRITTCDDANRTYTFEDVDSTVSSLEEGDTFACEYDGETVIVKVSSISVSGTTATVYGDGGIDLQTVFDYVKVDSTSGTSDAEVDASSTSDGVTYRGLGDESWRFSTVQAIDLSGSVEGSITPLSFELDNELSGEVSLGVSVNLKLYLSLSYAYFELSGDYGIKGEVSQTETSTPVKKSMKLAEVTVSPIAGVYVTLKPQFVVEFEYEETLAFEVSGTFGFSVSSDSGFKNLTSTPECETTLEDKGDVFVGIDLNPSVKVISEDLVEVDAEATVGAEVEATLDSSLDGDDSERHDCTWCIDGDVNGKLSVSFEGKLFNSDRLKYEFKLLDVSIKLLDFYYSKDYDEFGLTVCPHRSYRVDVTVTDGSNPIQGATVVCEGLDGELTTDADGSASFYLQKGRHSLRVSKGDSEVSKSINVLNATKSIKVNLTSGDSTEKDTPIATDPIGDLGSVSDSGYCGDGLTWTFYDSGTLAITGEGDVESYYYGSSAPWYQYREQIQYLVLGEGVTSTGSGTFEGLDTLAYVSMPSSLTTIDIGSFEGCSSLTSITIPDGVTDVGMGAFKSCTALTEVRLPSSITSIQDNTFNGCTSLRSVDVPDGVTDIADGAFYGCESLESVTIPNGVTSFDNYVFYGCESLKSVTIPDGTTSIGVSAFEGCSSLKDVDIPDSVTSIASGAFRGCSALESVTIPSSVTKVDTFAFDGCTSLVSVTIPDSITDVAYGTFRACTSLESVTIPASVTYLSYSAFEGCTSLRSIVVPGSVTGIGNSAFKGCTALESVVIPSSVTKVDESAFSRCEALKDVYYTGTEGEWSAISIGYGNDVLTDATIHYGYVSGGAASTSAQRFSTVSEGSTASRTVSLEGLSPNAVYNVYVMEDRHAQDLLSSDNLLYVSQVTTGSDGSLSLSYQPREDLQSVDVVVVGMATGRYLDLLRLKKYVLGVYTDLDASDYDYNGDGRVDVLDVLTLKSSLSY